MGAWIPAHVEGSVVWPFAFVSTVARMLEAPAHIAAVSVAIIVALALAGLPSGSGLLIAAVCAMVTGVVVETLLERRA